MGETNFGIMSNTSTLKKLCGSDLMRYEIKGKETFTAYNYAKILIASNNLPISEDTSDGFYRRWVILDFDNKFPEGKDILQDIPESEYNNLSLKITEILPILLERGCFTNQGEIEQRKKRYIMASNPLPVFIEQYCHIAVSYYNRYSEVYTSYCRYLVKHNKRVISKKEFSKLLDIEGYENRKTSKDGQIDYYIEGFMLKNDKQTIIV